MAAATMQALVLTDEGLQLDRSHPMPDPAPGEALIRVRLCGICSTDLELIKGYKGGFRGVLGHEFVGEVVQADSESTWVGQRVVGEINIGCGGCSLCRRGLQKHCRGRQSIGILGRNGVFAEYLTLPVANLHLVPATVSDDEAVFTEPLAAAFEVLEQAPVDSSTRLFVLGDGRLGALCALVLAKTGCDLTVIGRHSSKLALLQVAGIQNTVVANSEHLAELAAKPADVVVEATGSPSGFDAALNLTRPLGALVLKSTYADRLSEFDISRLVVDEVSVIGSRCGPFAPALAALVDGTIDPRPLIHARYALGSAHTAFDHARQKGVLKVLIDPTVSGP